MDDEKEDLADRVIPSLRSRKEAAAIYQDFSHLLSELLKKETLNLRELKTIRELQDLKEALVN